MKNYLYLSILLFPLCLSSCGTSAASSEPAASSSEETTKQTNTETTEETSKAEYPFTDEEYLAMNDEDYIKNFFPVTRFSLASDLHIHDSDSEKSTYYRRAVKVCTISNKVAFDESNNYVGLDAILIAGDMVDNGKISQYQKVKGIFDQWMKEGTKLITCTGNHDYWNDKANTIATYLSVFTDQQEDQVVDVGQFKVISMCASENGDTAHFSEQKIAWLEKQLRSISKKSPNMPIFVMTHYAQFNTVYGSYNTRFGTSDLEETLSAYPQVVYMAGHSHFPISDPRSLYQGNYTAINTGTTAYSVHSIHGIGETTNSFQVFPSDHYGSYVSKCPWVGDPYEIGDLQIIEVNKFGSILIKGYDLLENQQIFTRLVRYPADKTQFKTNEMKKEESKNPEFGEDASLYFHYVESKSILVHIPPSVTDEYIESYRCEIYSNNELVHTKYLLGDFFLWPHPDTYILKDEELTPDTDYVLKVYAVNAYGKDSTKPLESAFHTLAEE